MFAKARRAGTLAKLRLRNYISELTISTQGQDHALQVDALTKAGCEKMLGARGPSRLRATPSPKRWSDAANLLRDEDAQAHDRQAARLRSGRHPARSAGPTGGENRASGARLPSRQFRNA